MKAKREFYMHGNDRQFADEYLISTMTGEPMPKKWQRFIELTPEEKARWDASLRLDAEYRVAEAQGFPNGIPGGRTRGSGLYTITQMEEEHERELQKNRMEEAREQYEQSFIPYKTEIQNNTNTIYGNINLVNQLWQNPYNTQTNDLTTGISAFSGLQTEKEPAFDVNQAVQKLADRVRAIWASGEDQSKMRIPSKLELYEVLSPYGMTYKEIKDIYPQTAQNQKQVDVSSMTYEDMQNIGKQIEAELNQIVENKPAGQDITDYEMYEVLSKYGVKYKDWRSIRLAIEEILKTSPAPRRYWRANDSVYERSVMQGEGAFFSPNLDLIEKILTEEKRALEKDIDQATLKFLGSVDTILALCPKDSRLAKLGARLGYALLAVAALRCVLDVQRRRENLINDLVAQGRERRDAEAETLPIYHKWLRDELTTLVLEDWVSDFLPLILIPQKNEENPGASII